MTGSTPTPGTGEPPDATGATASAPKADAEIGTDPASVAAPPNRRAALLRSGLIVGILFVVFVIILPRFVDYKDVVESLKGLTLGQIALMTVLGAIGWWVSGLLFVALIPGLTIVRGGMSYLILSGIGSSVPFGPWNMGVVWVILRGWGIDNRTATSGIALYGVISWLARVILPLLAVIFLVAAGDLNGDGGPILVITIISIIAFVVATTLLVVIVRSDRIADWIGRTGQRLATWTLQHLGRKEGPDVSGAIHRFRDQLGEVVRRRGFIALVAGTVAQVFWAFVLLVALRIVGVPEKALSPAEIFAVYALVSVITIIPISPGGAGVPELLFIAGFSAIAGESYESAITAGVILYRVYNWFLPIPLAWILLKVARPGRSILPTAAEIKADAHGEPV